MTMAAGVQVLLQQLSQTSKSTSLLDSILGCLVYALQQDAATSKASTSASQPSLAYLPLCSAAGVGNSNGLLGKSW